jgi:hypothetical protein
LPFAGADTALGQLGTRACAAYDAASVTASLEARGYVAASAWRREAATPATVETTELDGVCGVLAIVSPSSSLSTLTIANVPIGVSCSTMVATLALCASVPVVIGASGPVDVRAFVMPGVTPDDIERSGLPVEVALAHVEAEVLLAQNGWVPSDEIVTVPSGASNGSTVTLDPPAAPSTGCVGWVVVAPSMRMATPTSWAAPGAATRVLSNDNGNGRATLGGVSCRDTTGVLAATGFELTSVEAAPPVYFRAYTPRPLSLGAPPAVRVRGAFSLRTVDPSAATLPATTPYAPTP